ncbi:MAG TPA: DUF1638 domain-containing protein [Anaerolineaceae bacterium]|nr:DUF1638 domain-containing protein [Anaerolineaceae bacterium]
MKIKCLACDALARLVYLSAAHSPHIVDVTLLQLGLHNQPANLRKRLQAEIDSASGQGYQAVVLGYALCGRATEGLVAREVPVILPRAHDCITLFLGSRLLYTQEHDSVPGTYWYALDFIERNDMTGGNFILGSEDLIQPVYEEYVKKYGKDNADYLMEVMGAWKNNYERAVYIEMGVGDGQAVEQRARNEASRRGWAFERRMGDLRLIHKLLAGEWDEDMLVVQPGQRISMSMDENIICAEEKIEIQP